MLHTKHLKMVVVPIILLALLSAAAPVVSAQETTDGSFYRLTITPLNGDIVIDEPDTAILFDSSSGELVNVLPSSEAEGYSVTVLCGCADSSVGYWASGNTSGDMQFTGIGAAAGPWLYRNSYTVGNKLGQTTFAVGEAIYTPVVAGPWIYIAMVDGSDVDSVSVTHW